MKETIVEINKTKNWLCNNANVLNTTELYT